MIYQECKTVTEFICPICNQKFYVSCVKDWLYREPVGNSLRQKRLLCSYHCMRQAERMALEKKLKRRTTLSKEDRERIIKEHGFT